MGLPKVLTPKQMKFAQLLVYGVDGIPITKTEAFKLADDVLYQGISGITDLITSPGMINLDFSDIKTVMQNMGKAMMGTGENSGDGRAKNAAEMALNCYKKNLQILENEISGEEFLIFNRPTVADCTLFSTFTFVIHNFIIVVTLS